MAAVRATQTFVVARSKTDPVKRIVKRGEVFSSKDPIVKGRETLFEDLDEIIERATANPGEKRTVKKTSTK